MRLGKERQLFKNRQFSYLLLEQILTQFSYNLVSFSSIVNVFKLTRSNFSVAVLLLCFFIPSIFTTMIAGMVSDHFYRKKILVTANIIWATLVLCMVFARNYYWLFLLVTILIQITDEFFQNANAATIPLLVEEKNLITANSLFSLTNYLCLILGSVCVGFLIRLFSPAAPFLAASLLVYLAAFFVSRLKFEQKLVKMPKNKEIFEHIKDQVTKGWTFIRSSQTVSLLVAFVVSLTALQSLVLAISPGYVENVLGIEAADASFVFALPLGIGLLVAGYFLGKFGKRVRKIELIRKGMVLVGTGLLFLALIPESTRVANFAKNTKHFESILHTSLPLALVVMTLGFGGALVFVPAYTSFQENIPDQLRGRVLSTSTLLTYIFSSLLTLGSGFIADKIGFFPILFILAMLGIFLGLFSKKILVGAKVLEK